MFKMWRIRSNKSSKTNSLGNFVSNTTCDACGGKGQIIEEACPDCKGKGRIRKHRKITVKIPAGVDTGNVLPLRGQGEDGVNGGPAGDLYIRINVQQSKVFKRNGADIYYDYKISIGKATLGEEIIVPTIDGNVKYKVPAGTQPGTRFRLKGKGVPRVNSQGRGDQYVNIIVEVPKNLNKEQEAALKEFMSTMGEVESGHHEEKSGLKSFFKKK